MAGKGKGESSAVEKYIAAQPPKARAALRQLRSVIKKAAPGAEEVISYRMPAFRLHGGIVVWYASFKNHCGLYPFSKTIRVFRDKLKGYELSTGTIRFPLDKPIPVKLVREIVKFNAKENLGKELLKRNKKKQKR